MGSPKSRKHRWYNKLCLRFLKILRYTVEPDMQSPSGWHHLPVMLLPLAMSIISFVTLGEIKAFLVIYHILTLGFKLMIACFEKRNFDEKAYKGTNDARNNVVTPYFLRLLFLAFEVGILLFLLVLALLSAPDITIGTFSTATVIFSLLFSWFENSTNGIVSLYAAAVMLPNGVA